MTGFLVGIVVTCILVSVAPRMFSAMPIFSQDNSTIQTYAIFKQIKSENELTTASQAYDIADWYGGSTKIKNFSIPFTSSGFVYRYSGTIKAGVNLKTAKFKFRKKDKTIVVTLNQPMILSNTMDPKRTGVRYEENNIFHQLSPSDLDILQKKIIKQSEFESVKLGILKQAKANAEKNLSLVFTSALGKDYQVQVIWR